MNSDSKYNQNNHYSGGFAEIVSKPSILTYSFFEDWFKGNGSLGKAMKLLGLPYKNTNEAILERVNAELLINLSIEEKTLYEDTIFKYKRQLNPNDIPKLYVSLPKLISPLNWTNTLKILAKQSIWISQPDKILLQIEQLVKGIPLVESSDMEYVDEQLKNNIWPAVLAVGIVSEFFNQLIVHEVKKEFSSIQSYISQEAAPKDWFFKSLSDQYLVKDKSMSFDDYIKAYGIRADKDYELSAQRWYEIPETIKRRIDETNSNSNSLDNRDLVNSLPKKTKSFIKVAIELQILRSEVKRKTLVAIDALRRVIIHQFCDDNCEHGESCPIQQRHKSSLISNPLKAKQNDGFKASSILTKGRGIGVSFGVVSGMVVQVSSNNLEIPKGAIGIFPNSSPEFSTLYPKCAGMIFLKGGQTSHGAVVAREYGIPALVDENVASLVEKTKVKIDGASGEWSTEENVIQSSESKKTKTNYLMNLREISKVQDLVGGKAASLGELIRINLPVPGGFVITAEAFKDFSNTTMPEDLQAEILRAFDQLKTSGVAVRSSALMEDSASASFAGQLESYLNVSKTDLITKIVECWDSVNSPRVKEYAKQHNIPDEQLLVAVLVQQMVESQVSGVLFTTNPVSKNKNEILIEAALGLGEIIVQGLITPSSFVIDKTTQEIKSKDVQAQDKQIVFKEGGTKEVTLSKEQQNQIVLTDTQIKELVKAALKIEDHYGLAQDIEWAFAKGKLYILQSRPITT